MTLQIRDTAPDFTAETTQGLSACTSTSARAGGSCSLIPADDIAETQGHALKPYLRLTPQPNR